MAFWALVRALVRKNFRLLLLRQPLICVFTAVVLPIALCAFFSYATNLIFPNGTFGIGSSRPIKNLAEAFEIGRSSGRDKIVLVNGSGKDGSGKIGRVLGQLEHLIAGQDGDISVIQTSNESSIVHHCLSNPRGATGCFGAITVWSSPDQGTGHIWNYTIKTDAALANSALIFDTGISTNPEQVYILPIQRAIDRIIAKEDGKNDQSLANTMELPFTSRSQAERDAQARRFHHRAIVNSMGVTFISSILWITYHMTGFLTSEKEMGMSQLIDSMASVDQPAMSLIARTLANHLSFSAIYAPGWIICSIIMHYVVYYNTNIAIVIVFHLLAGLAMASASILIASLFRRAQLSGATAILGTLILAILAQTVNKPGIKIVAPLSVLFVPCNYVYFSTLMARFELRSLSTSLTALPPDSPWRIPGWVMWLFLILQIVVYPVIAISIEFMGTNMSWRQLWMSASVNKSSSCNHSVSVQLEGITKTYRPKNRLRSFFRWMRDHKDKNKHKREDNIIAVNNLSLTVDKGQIVALLGANGSGKTTTLQAIAGWNKLTSGSITIDRTGGFGIAPQKNVMWDELTVEQHLRVFYQVKALKTSNDDMSLVHLLKSIGLCSKRDSLAKTLSGGQKRRLQLGIMLVGGSAVCCVDEVSSGVDPVSRHRLWDILLAERGTRTIIMTTHYLDEADALADQVVILSKGSLCAQGSALDLKVNYGNGFTIQADGIESSPPFIPGVSMIEGTSRLKYSAATTTLAVKTISALEAAGITNYQLMAPTLEDAFINIIKKNQPEDLAISESSNGNDSLPGADDIPYTPSLPCTEESLNEQSSSELFRLLDGKSIGRYHHMRIMLKKRLILLRRNPLPYVFAIVLPIFAAGLTSLYVRGQSPVGCIPPPQNIQELEKSAFSQIRKENLMVIAGPTSRISQQGIMSLLGPLFGGQTLFNNTTNSTGSSIISTDTTATNANSNSSTALVASALKRLRLVDTYDELQRYIHENKRNVTSGIWLGDEQNPPTIAWVANLFITTALTSQQILDNVLTNTTIATSWAALGTAEPPGIDGSFSLVIYMSIALVCFPALFSLYPTFERVRFIRSLQYSSGVHPISLWSAYMIFDFALATIAIGIAVALWAGLSSVWFHLGYVFLVLVLYGFASILLSYIVSFISKTQLSSFVWATGLQAAVLVIYLLLFFCISTYTDASKVERNIAILHFTISILAPIGPAIRSLFLATNLFATACVGSQVSSNPMSMTAYGGPVLYLVIQSFIFLGVIIYIDSPSGYRNLLKSTTFKKVKLEEKGRSHINNASDGGARTITDRNNSPISINDQYGLKAAHLTKSFGKAAAVDDVSFEVGRGEIFALLGPNGAGKSTTMSLIHGDMKPSSQEAQISIDGYLMSAPNEGATAKRKLGFCPQFDAFDRLTVQEHLEFHASIRGISDPRHNVLMVLQALGLEAKASSMAETLSGGNKRKLSLGIALVGNPSVLLLDEPSSSLDAHAKRSMWQTLLAAAKGRSILFTTHSMEEADAISHQVGILSCRMLAMGTSEELSRRFGHLVYVHLIASTAPTTTREEANKILSWIRQSFPLATIDGTGHRGQIRFSVRRDDILGMNSGSGISIINAIGKLVMMLEDIKHHLGIRHFGVYPATLNQVFLTILGDSETDEASAETA